MLFACCYQANAQIIYFEDFQNGMPSSIILVDNDGLTPVANTDYVTNAWVARDDFGSADSVAVSNSWYDPSGKADDWMIIPNITIGANSRLSFQVRSQDADFFEHYQVLISTTGTAISNFTDTIYENNAEQATNITRAIDLTAAGYSNTTINIAFRNISEDKFILVIDDIQVKNLTATDASVVDIAVPNASCTLTSAEDVSISILNDGLAAISNFNVSYSVNAGTPITENFTGTILPTETATYTFTQKADFSAKNSLFQVIAFSSLLNDSDVNNDTAAVSATINIASVDVSADGYETSYESNSEILGWSVEDANNDGFSWGLIQGNSYDGDLSFAYLYNANSNADDWLYSTCLDLQGGQPYRLDFFYEVGESQGTVFPENLAVYFGNAPAAAAMTNLLKDFGSVNNSEYLQSSLAITPAATGTYYVGYKCYSPADQFFLSIDQVSLSELQAPTASFSYNVGGFDVAFSSPQGEDPINTLTWNFGDNQDSTINQSGIIHSYNTSGNYNVCLTVTNAAGTATFCDTVNIVDTLSSVLNTKLLSLKTYPNPAKESIVIELKNNTKADIIITNTLGETVLTQQIDNKTKHTLNLSNIANGVYFITVEQNGLKYLNKFSVLR